MTTKTLFRISSWKIAEWLRTSLKNDDKRSWAIIAIIFTSLGYNIPDNLNTYSWDDIIPRNDERIVAIEERVNTLEQIIANFSPHSPSRSDQGFERERHIAR